MFYFRADGNQKIAMGHIMRCLTIAEALRSRGEEILFLTADENPVEFIRKRGFAAEILHARYDDMEAELPRLERILTASREAGGKAAENRNVTEDDGMAGAGSATTGSKAAENRSTTAGGGAVEDRAVRKPKILVDSYFVTPRYLERLRLLAKVILMDDEKKTVYPCDGLVNYSIYGKTLGYERDYPEATRLFLGLDYMPLRGEFRDRSYEVRDRVKDILFTTGGGDGFHAALRMTERLLEKMEGSEILRAGGEDGEALWTAGKGDESRSAGLPTWHIVCGPYHPDTGELERLAAGHPFLRIHKNVTCMSELMLSCDIAVSAAGSTLYELCSIGIPAVGFYFAENQRRNMETFARLTPVKNAGDFSLEPEQVLDFIEKEVEVLCREKTLREKMSRVMRTIVDGKGADRLAEELRLL